jgi:hypothetical protein
MCATPGLVLECCEAEPDNRVRLAPLPALQAAELEELHLAIKERMNTLAGTRLGQVHAGNDKTVAEIDRRGLILQSLDTAVQEARASLR